MNNNCLKCGNILIKVLDEAMGEMNWCEKCQEMTEISYDKEQNDTPNNLC